MNLAATNSERSREWCVSDEIQFSHEPGIQYEELLIALFEDNYRYITQEHILECLVVWIDMNDIIKNVTGVSDGEVFYQEGYMQELLYWSIWIKRVSMREWGTFHSHVSLKGGKESKTNIFTDNKLCAANNGALMLELWRIHRRLSIICSTTKDHDHVHIYHSASWWAFLSEVFLVSHQCLITMDDHVWTPLVTSKGGGSLHLLTLSLKGVLSILRVLGSYIYLICQR
jgi:hypothetical protein